MEEKAVSDGKCPGEIIVDDGAREDSFSASVSPELV